MRKYKRTSNKQFGIYMLVFSLIITQAGITLSRRYNETNKNKVDLISGYHELYKTNRASKSYIVENESENEKQNKSLNKPQEFVVTAYDLSVASTGKSRGNPEFGITKDGTDLKGENWMSARVIAVDPRVIPLGSRVLIEFVDEKYKKYNGVYVCRDIGEAIKGNRIDLFIEDSNSNKPSKKAINFGKTTAFVTILEYE